ncbi:MAG: MerR family transcriptional regulator [Colwellia sp.]|nr:MerR family transcriptional regulator [Colwellia sp.]
MTIKEYAKKNGVTRKTVHDWINKGLLTYELTPSGRKRITGVKEQKDIERQ